MTPEQLADMIDNRPDNAIIYGDKAAAELRRLAAENAALRALIQEASVVLNDSRYGALCNRKEVRDLCVSINAAMKKETP